MKDALGVDAELKVGPSGSFEISVDGKVVSSKGRFGFPSESDIVKAVGQALGGQATA